MLIQFARNYAIVGDTGKQFANANEANRLLAGLAAEKPDDTTYQLQRISRSPTGRSATCWWRKAI